MPIVARLFHLDKGLDITIIIISFSVDKANSLAAHPLAKFAPGPDPFDPFLDFSFCQNQFSFFQQCCILYIISKSVPCQAQYFLVEQIPSDQTRTNFRAVSISSRNLLFPDYLYFCIVEPYSLANLKIYMRGKTNPAQAYIVKTRILSFNLEYYILLNPFLHQTE